MKRTSSAVVSPNGKWALAAVTEPAYDESKTATDLWIVPVDGSAPARKRTNTKAAESGAVLSPDSTQVAFSTKREGDEAAQIYVLPLAGGAARNRCLDGGRRIFMRAWDEARVAIGVVRTEPTTHCRAMMHGVAALNRMFAAICPSRDQTGTSSPL